MRIPGRPGARPDRHQVDGVTALVSRSERRRKTVSARRIPEGIEVLLPAGLDAAQEREWVEVMVRKVVARQERRRPPRDDEALQRRAVALARAHLDEAVGAPVRASEIRWVTNQNHRWGSCTPGTGVIRLSSRLQEMPDWVVDHVLVHELVHLVEREHSARFHALVARHPESVRATGFLEGWELALRSAQATAPSCGQDGAVAGID